MASSLRRLLSPGRERSKGASPAGTVLIVFPGEEFQIRKKEFLVAGPNGTVPMAEIPFHSNEVIIEGLLLLRGANMS